MFLVAYIREGGNAPVQGAMLVQGASLEAASAAATQALQAELEADIRDHGELPEAMVMLLNAAEVPALDAASRNASTPVLATVFW
jgi:predicted RNase H-like HicB family nuclease